METIETNSAYPQSNPKPTRAEAFQPDYAVEMRVAHLLLEAKIITLPDLEAALELAIQYGQQVTKVLDLKLNFPTDTLKAARHAQKSVDTFLLDSHTAATALRMSHTAGLPFDYVVARTEKASSNHDSFSVLESLLLESGIVSETSMREARAVHWEQNVPISAGLLMTKTVQYSHLNYACECLHLLREGLVSKTSAIHALATVREEKVDLRTALEKQGNPASHSLSRIKIGDLLVEGKIVSEGEMLGKVEESIASKRLIGSLLVESGLIDEDMLIDALILQAFCAKEIVDRYSTVKILRKAVESQRDLASTAKTYQAFCDEPQTAGGAIDLLLRAGIVTEDEIDQAQARYYSYGMGTLKALVASGFLSPGARRAAIECTHLTAKNLLTDDEAISVLRCRENTETDLDQTLSQLPMAREEEELRIKEQTITMEFSRSKLIQPKLYKSAEFPWLVAVAFFFCFGATMTTVYKPCNMGGFGILLVTFLTGAAMIHIGLRWDRTVRTKWLENAAKEETARETVKRLSGAKRKFA